MKFENDPLRTFQEILIRIDYQNPRWPPAAKVTITCYVALKVLSFK